MKVLLTSVKVGRVTPCEPSGGSSATARGGLRPTSERSAFTMVEIALALAIIGFALVAIVGALPFGLNVQRENREETIIVQDANFLIDAIRNGARGLDDLTNYVECITNYVTVFDVNGNPRPGDPEVWGYTNNATSINNLPGDPAHVLTNGHHIIGLLSTPKYLFNGNDPYHRLDQPVTLAFRSNYVIAYIRALSGAAVEKPPQANLDVRDLSFRYRLIAELVPFSNWNTNWVDFTDPTLLPAEVTIRSNRWRADRLLQANSLDLRLNFRWPINGRREAGNSFQAFRTLISGSLTNQPNGTPFWFVRSSTYQSLQ
jgi:type II secretory pathway pseudopilin PulG